MFNINNSSLLSRHLRIFALFKLLYVSNQLFYAFTKLITIKELIGVPTIPRPRDLVLITWQRNPLTPNSRRTIAAVRVIGSAQPCRNTLVPGTRLFRALRCLRTHGFTVVCRGNSTSVSGFVLLQR
jgi:hypothetical protein